MPSPIGTISQLVAVIRRQLSVRTDRAPLPRATSKGQIKNRSQYSPENLESLIIQHIKNIDRDDPKRGRKAFRIFLESVLLSHFGEHLINDPKFYQLVDDIQTSMESDPEVSTMVNTAIAHLISDETR